MPTRECARLEALNGEPIHLMGVNFSGDLRGLLMEARVEQHFCNPGETNVEVVYSFPLPWGAVLLGVDVVLGDKQLTGAVVEKKQAEARYEEALCEGNAAIMLERNRDYSYSLNLGNLAAREHCTVTLRYAQTLQFEQRGLRVLIPTVIAPRYGDATRNGGLLPHQVPSHSLQAEHPFTLALRLHGGLAQARVASPSHPLSVVYAQSESRPILTVSLARQATLDRDFVLVVDQLVNDSMVIAARDCIAPDVVVVLASFCPCITTEKRTATAVKILVDCSGSMAGDSIDAAKRALQAIVQQLDTGDQFSLSRFGSTVEHRSRGLWKTTEATRLAAQRWVGALEANLGGTDMEPALVSTFDLAQQASSDILLVTDGQISAIDPIIAAAKVSGHRLFIVGIGSSAAETHLRRLAETTGGACDFVAPGEAVEPAVLRMFARLRSPRLADLQIEWPEDVVPQWVSPLLPAVFDGDTVNVFALLGRTPVGQVRLLGRRAKEGATKEIGCAALTGALESSDTLSRIAADLRLRSAGAGDRAESLQDAAALAVAYQLVSDRTNFLLVQERAESEKPVEMPALQKVPQMMPAGWSGVGSVRFSRRRKHHDSPSGTAAPAIQADAAPSVWRMSKAPRRLAQASLMDDFELPAFLRRDVDDASDSDDLRQREQILVRKDPHYWLRSEHYHGLTPLGVCEWLRLTPETHWPTSYEGLRQIGLGQGLVDWLELVLATCSGTVYAEALVVGAFTHLMSLQDIHGALTKLEDPPATERITAHTLQQLFLGTGQAFPQGVDLGLVKALVAGLEGMRARGWPDRVFALDCAVSESN